MNTIQMNTKYLSAALSIFILFFVTYSLARAEGEHIVRGNIVCIEIDGEGNANVSEEFTRCSGLVYMLGVDGKIYSLHGSEDEMKKINASSKTRMGYRLPLRLKGTEAGHQRAWRLYTPSLEPQEEGDSKVVTVTGTVLCIFPKFGDGNISPMVATAPCNEYEDHAHVIYTSEGQTYAIHGPHEKITAIEKTANRKSVTLSGYVQGNNGGWILYVN
jgi:hypothetical protein